MDELNRLLKGLFSEDEDEDDRPRKKRNSDDDEDEDMPPQHQQKALLEDLLEKTVKFSVGDYVKRNKLGKRRYKWPKDDEVAMVTHVFKEGALMDGGPQPGIVHGEITCCKMQSGKLVLASSCVDLRYYDKVSSAPQPQVQDED